MNQKTELNNFISAINEEAKRQKQKIELDTQNFVANELERAENEALAESYNLIQQEITKIRSEFGSELSKKSSFYFKDCLLRRDEICNNLFAGIKAKLLEFVNSENYFPFLIKTAKKCSVVLENEPAIVFIKACDMHFADDISKAIDTYKFVEDNDIHIGGIKLGNKSKTLLINDTLDSRFLFEKKEFYKNSQLLVSKISNN